MNHIDFLFAQSMQITTCYQQQLGATAQNFFFYLSPMTVKLTQHVWPSGQLDHMTQGCTVGVRWGGGASRYSLVLREYREY